jgi:hypothetical protein
LGWGNLIPPKARPSDNHLESGLSSEQLNSNALQYRGYYMRNPNRLGSREIVNMDLGNKRTLEYLSTLLISGKASLVDFHSMPYCFSDYKDTPMNCMTERTAPRIGILRESQCFTIYDELFEITQTGFQIKN